MLLIILILCKLNLVVTTNLSLLGLFPRSHENDRWIIESRTMFRLAINLSHKMNMTFNGKYLTGEEILTDDDDLMLTLNSTCDKIFKSNIIGFIGPAYSNEVRYLSSFASRLGIPIVSYSSTSADLSTIANRSFHRISPSDELTVLALKMLFIENKWKSCLIIYQNDEFGYNGMQLLNQKLTQINIKIFPIIKFDRYQLNFPIDFQNSFNSSLSRIVIVWANEISTRKILIKALEYNLLGQHFVWILTSTISLEYFNPIQQQNLIGILTIEPFHRINQTLFNQIWKQEEEENENYRNNLEDLSIYALFTFDATWSLILSLEKLCLNDSSCLQFQNNISHCLNRQFLNWKKYSEIIHQIEFEGISGRIKFNCKTSDRISDISYLIKNIQQLTNRIGYVPVLQWNQNQFKWIKYQNQSNEIFWTKQSTQIPMDHKLIQGQQLRIAIIESPPSIIVKNSNEIYKNFKENYQIIEMSQFDGFYKDFLVYLQEKMLFNPIILLAKPTIRYDELVEGVANDTFDIVLSSIDINAKRNKIVDFSIAIMPASYRILIRKPNLIQSDYFLNFKTFLWIFWLFLIIMIPYTNILIWITEPKYQQNNSLIGIFVVFSYPIYSPFNQIQTKTGQFLTRISSILQILLLIVHTSGLISIIVTQNSQLIVSGIDDIKNGKIPSNRIGILVGSQIEEYYLNSISQGKKNYFPLKTPEEIYTRLINGDIDASLWSNISTAYHLKNIYCNLMTVGLEFSHSFYQIPIKHHWLYTNDFNLNILSFMESEQLERISLKWFATTNCSKPINRLAIQTKTLVGITMTRLFITFAIISFFSIIFHLYSKRSKILNRKKSHLFLLVDISTRLNRRSSAMLNLIYSLNKDFIQIEPIFDINQFKNQIIFIFTTNKFAQTIENQSKQIEKIFILDKENPNQVDNQLRFNRDEDLIYQLADEISHYYLNQQQIQFLYQQLKQIYQQFTNEIKSIELNSTRIIWIQSNLQTNQQIEKVRNLFSQIVCSFSVFNNLSDLIQFNKIDYLFVILNLHQQDSILKQFTNLKLISNENDFSTICSQLKTNLIYHYNKLGTYFSLKKDHQIAKQMFSKAHQLCLIKES